MRTQEVKIYQFSELSEKGKEKVLERFRYINVEDMDWYNHVYDYVKEKTNILEISDMRFSGFCSQGDGASFLYDIKDGVWERWVDLQNLPNWKKEVLKYAPIGVYTRRNTHHYAHSNTISVSYEIEDFGCVRVDEFIEEYATKFLDSVSEKASDLMNTLYTTLEKEYEFKTSDEIVAETIEASEYEFTKDGKPW